MSLLEVPERVRELLARNGRTSYRMLRRELAAARAIKARRFEPGIWLERAALAEAQGNTERVRKHKDTARALWLEMGSERNAARIG